VGSEHQRCREGSEAIAASSHERAAHGKEILEPLCQPIRFLPHLYRLSANPSHSLMLIRRSLCRITRRTLLQKVREGRIPGHPLDCGAKKKEWRFKLSELDRYLSLCDKLRSAAT